MSLSADDAVLLVNNLGKVFDAQPERIPEFIQSRDKDADEHRKKIAEGFYKRIESGESTSMAHLKGKFDSATEFAKAYNEVKDDEKVVEAIAALKKTLGSAGDAK